MAQAVAADDVGLADYILLVSCYEFVRRRSGKTEEGMGDPPSVFADCGSISSLGCSRDSSPFGAGNGERMLLV